MMSHMLTVMSLTLMVTAALMLFVWLLSIVRKDASIVDIFWGLGFILIAVVCSGFGGGYESRRILITALTTVWGLRLASHIFWRNKGKGEDFRYRAMRARHGKRFSLVSLYSVFALQGLLIWVISLPLQIAEISSEPARLTW